MQPRNSDPSDAVTAAQPTLARTLTGNVLVAGVISFFTDISSEMIVPVLPLFLSSVLGAPMAAIGIIEGLAESTSSVVRGFAGWLSDRAGKRKPFVMSGYVLSNFSKPLLALVASWPQVLLLRFADRLGKGIRTAPRDALIADSVAPQRRGLAFGFHRSLDTAGAALGPLVAFATLSVFPENYRAVFWIAAVPGALAVVIGLLFLRELARTRADTAAPRFAAHGLGRRFTIFTAVATLFALGNSSDAFLILRARHLGVSAVVIPLVYLAFNVVYAVLATPAGALSDRLGRRTVLAVGYVIFTLVYLGFALVPMGGGVGVVLPLFVVYGGYYALTEGVQKALITDLVPAASRATAIGTFSMATGLALLPASVIAGALWDRVGPSAPFLYGAIMAFLALILLLALLPRGIERASA